MSSPRGSEFDPAARGPEDQPDWGAPPPPAHGPGTPAPGRPAPSDEPGTTPGRRPPQVLAAAVLGFVVAFFLLIGALVLFAASTLFGALSAVFGILYLALTALNVVGGVQAIQGRGSTLLKIAGGITAGLGVLSLVTYLAQGSFDFSTLVSILIGAAIVFLLVQPASKAYFASRGTK
jgi:hypothetical protein